MDVMGKLLVQRKSFVHLATTILILEENHTVLSNMSGEIGSMLSANIYLHIVFAGLIKYTLIEELIHDSIKSKIDSDSLVWFQSIRCKYLGFIILFLI
jgi:hypothetical protein